jgi:KRAB domain-containing zinc finger protein
MFRKYITLYCHIKAICGNENAAAEGAGEDGRMACSECSTRFSSYENLRRHKRLTCRKQPEFKCPSCPFVSRYKASLEQHVRSQHRSLEGEHLHRCAWCRKKFKHAQTLKRHEIYSCGKEKGFFCGHCDYKCYLKYQLKNHMRRKHEGLFCNGAPKD